MRGARPPAGILKGPNWYGDGLLRIRAYLALDVNGDDLLYKGGSLAGRVWLSTWERGAIICLGGLGYLLIVPYPATICWRCVQ